MKFESEDLGIKTGTTSRDDLISSHAVLGGVPSSKQVFQWLKNMKYQTEEGPQEYIMYFDVDMPKILNDRIDYIENLHNLEDNWVNGTCFKPNKKVIDDSIKLLKELNVMLIDECIKIPKLIMGPIPSGGFSIEFVMSNEKNLVLNLYNNNTCEIEYSISGHYFEY